MKILSRKKFYKSVKFKDKKAKNYLKNAIFYYATSCGINYFENITNYISHATVTKEDSNVVSSFNICYPITISGISIYDINILDAKGKSFHIALMPNKTMVYYEKYEETLNVFVATWEPNKNEEMFYSKKVYYHIENM